MSSKVTIQRRSRSVKRSNKKLIISIIVVTSIFSKCLCSSILILLILVVLLLLLLLSSLYHCHNHLVIVVVVVIVVLHTRSYDSVARIGEYLRRRLLASCNSVGGGGKYHPHDLLDIYLSTVA